MARNIAVADDIYDGLSNLKREGESFSDVIRRLIKAKPMIVDLAGRNTFTTVEAAEVAEVFDTQIEKDMARKKDLLNQVK